MVASRILTILICILAMPVAFAADDPYEGGDLAYKPKPYRMTPVRRVEIQVSGAWTANVSSDETREECSRFRPDAADVRRFFRLARRASFNAYSHDLSMSRCYSTGTLVLASGDRGEWFIDRDGRGAIRLSDARLLYFDCSRCRFRRAIDPRTG